MTVLPDNPQLCREVMAILMSILLPFFHVLLALLFSVLQLDVLLKLSSFVHSIVALRLLVKGKSRSGHLVILATLYRAWIETLNRCHLNRTCRVIEAIIHIPPHTLAEVHSQFTKSRLRTISSRVA